MVSAEDREKAYLSACDQFCKLAGPTLETEVVCVERDLEAKLPDSAGELMMTWEQVKALESEVKSAADSLADAPDPAIEKPAGPAAIGTGALAGRSAAVGQVR